MSTITFVAPDTNTNIYLKDQLQWIKENNINIDDYVKILLKPSFFRIERWENITNVQWENEMDSFVGDIARIVSITDTGICLDSERPNSICYCFPYFCLEKYDTRILKESQTVYLNFYFGEKNGLVGKIIKVTNNGYLIKYDDDGTILFIDAIYKKYIINVTTFKHNELVLVKNNNKISIWIPGLFAYADFNTSHSYYIKQSQNGEFESYKLCIPLKGNEHLCGTSKSI